MYNYTFSLQCLRILLCFNTKTNVKMHNAYTLSVNQKKTFKEMIFRNDVTVCDDVTDVVSDGFSHQLLASPINFSIGFYSFGKPASMSDAINSSSKFRPVLFTFAGVMVNIIFNRNTIFETQLME